jgi:hypothetical protein
MVRAMDMVSLRLNSEIHDLIIKISHESGMSKQDVIRQMIISQLEKKYGENLMLNIRDVKNQIKREYEISTDDQIMYFAI